MRSALAVGMSTHQTGARDHVNGGNVGFAVYVYFSGAHCVVQIKISRYASGRLSTTGVRCTCTYVRICEDFYLWLFCKTPARRKGRRRRRQALLRLYLLSQTTVRFTSYGLPFLASRSRSVYILFSFTIPARAGAPIICYVRCVWPR